MQPTPKIPHERPPQPCPQSPLPALPQVAALQLSPSTIPVSTAVPVTTPAVLPAALANISTSSATGAAAEDGAVIKKKRVAIAADSPVRPSTASEEMGANSAGLLDAARADGQGALGSGTENAHCNGLVRCQISTQF